MSSTLAAPEARIDSRHIVRIHESQAAFEVAPGESVLEAGLRAGVALPHECQFGGCGTCRVRVLEGSVEYEEFPMGLTPEEAAEGYALACQARPSADLVIGTEGEPCAEPRRHVAKVVAVEALCHDVVHLTLALPEDAPAHRPGQYLRLFTEDGTPRSFSMASPHGGGTVDLHIRRIPGGRFTAAGLERLAPGAELEVELPHGSFYYRARDYRPLLMVATGTGLAPIKSILESLMDDEDCPPVALYWGARTPADLYLHERIPQWAGRLYDFQYVPVLSRAPADWQGRRGYVQHAVAEDFPDLSEHAIYLCGSPDMIRDARETFLRLGASASHLYADSFTFQRG